jgi:hypothetical protein
MTWILDTTAACGLVLKGLILSVLDQAKVVDVTTCRLSSIWLTLGLTFLVLCEQVSVL